MDTHRRHRRPSKLIGVWSIIIVVAVLITAGALSYLFIRYKRTRTTVVLNTPPADHLEFLLLLTSNQTDTNTVEVEEDPPLPDFFDSLTPSYNATELQKIKISLSTEDEFDRENVDIIYDPKQRLSTMEIEMGIDGLVGVYYSKYTNANPWPDCKLCNSSIQRDAPPMILEQGIWDEYSKIHDLYNVVFHNGVLHFYGLDQETFKEAVNNMTDTHYWLQPYKHYVGWVQWYEYSSDVFRFHTEPFDWTYCDDIIEDPSFMFSPWQPFNTYHAHNDNLFPLLVSYIRAGLTNVRKRLYINLYKENVVWEQSMALLAMVIPRLFDFRLFSELQQDRRRCFRHFRWGRGPMLWYHPLKNIASDPPTDFWAGLAPLAAQEVMKQFGVPARNRTGLRKPMGERIRALHLARTGARSIVNANIINEAFQRLGVSSVDCCPFENVPISLTLMQEADILWGVHGAGFTNEVYMPAGGLVVEIRAHSSMPEPIYWTGAKHAGHAYYMPSVRQYPESSGGYIVSEEWAQNMVAETLRRWNLNIDTPVSEYNRTTY